MTTALIDADLVAYRVSATVQEHEPFELCQQRIDVLMQNILDGVNAKTYRAFLTGKDNFRKKVNPEYKANRKDTVPPFYLQDCRKYLVESWNAEIVDGIEADDALGIHQFDDTIICSLDKDLLMIPGNHFSWQISGTSSGKEWVREATLTETSALDGLRKLYKQALIGDTADNIIGVTGIGKVKAAKIIDTIDTEQEMLDTVREMYGDDDRFVMNMQCLYILHNEAEFWTTQLLNRKRDLISIDPSLHGVIIKYESMTSTPVATSIMPT